MAKCDLCEEEGVHFRGATFGGKKRQLCSKCLGQFQIDKKENHVVLYDRPTEFNLSKSAFIVEKVSNNCKGTIWVYEEEHIKEFIKQLKEEIEKATFSDGRICLNSVCNIIKELTGERFK